VTVVVMYWISEQFSEFEGEPEMLEFLDWFEARLIEDVSHVTLL